MLRWGCAFSSLVPIFSLSFSSRLECVNLIALGCVNLSAVCPPQKRLETEQWFLKNRKHFRGDNKCKKEKKEKKKKEEEQNKTLGSMKSGRLNISSISQKPKSYHLISHMTCHLALTLQICNHTHTHIHTCFTSIHIHITKVSSLQSIAPSC